MPVVTHHIFAVYENLLHHYARVSKVKKVNVLVLNIISKEKNLRGVSKKCFTRDVFNIKNVITCWMTGLTVFRRIHCFRTNDFHSFVTLSYHYKIVRTEGISLCIEISRSHLLCDWLLPQLFEYAESDILASCVDVVDSMLDIFFRSWLYQYIYINCN